MSSDPQNSTNQNSFKQEGVANHLAHFSLSTGITPSLLHTILAGVNTTRQPKSKSDNTPDFLTRITRLLMDQNLMAVLNSTNVQDINHFFDTHDLTQSERDTVREVLDTFLGSGASNERLLTSGLTTALSHNLHDPATTRRLLGLLARDESSSATTEQTTYHRPGYTR